MRALRMSRSVGRLGLARVVSAVSPSRAAKVGPLELVTVAPPALPGPDWVRLRPRLAGICGSDLSTVEGSAGAYFEPIVSFPFTLGHEIVADVVDEPDRRVVVIPVLHCGVRGVDPPCDQCAKGDINRCERVAFGHIKPGLQTGYCCETGGGWSTGLVAHREQLVDVPDDLSDDDAVLVEPTACAVHAATNFDGQSAAVLGAGTLGLLTLAAMRQRTGVPIADVAVSAKYPHQQRFAREFGAEVCAPSEIVRLVRSRTSSLMVGDQLTGGVATVFDCIGTSESLQQALQIVRPGGEIVVVGMPADVTVDLTGLWHREVTIRGCYAYTRSDFDAALDLVRSARLGRLVSALYPLDDYADAIAHAAQAGLRGAVKVAFDMRNEK